MPVLGKTSSEISTRAHYFSQMINLQAAAHWAQPLQLQYHAASPKLVAEIYFAISEDYKRKFLAPGARTNPTKIAAFTCVAVAIVNPLRVGLPDANPTRAQYANGLFALRCACNIISHPYEHRHFDELKRWADQIAKIKLPSVQPMYQEALQNGGNTVSNWQLDLTYAEHDELKKLLNLFCVLEQLKIFQAAPATAVAPVNVTAGD